MRRAVEHRRIQSAYEARERESLERYKGTGLYSPIAEVFEKLQANLAARRKAIPGQ